MLTRLALAFALLACASPASGDARPDVVHPVRTTKPSDDVLRRELTDLQYDVTQRGET